ncbi:MAG: hypothetical protein ACRD6B_03890 [Bryobacteraceae bacterium]
MSRIFSAGGGAGGGGAAIANHVTSPTPTVLAVTHATAFVPDASADSLVYGEAMPAAAGFTVVTMGPSTGAENNVGTFYPTYGFPVTRVPAGWKMVIDQSTPTAGMSVLIVPVLGAPVALNYVQDQLSANITTSVSPTVGFLSVNVTPGIWFVSLVTYTDTAMECYGHDSTAVFTPAIFVADTVSPLWSAVIVVTTAGTLAISANVAIGKTIYAGTTKDSVGATAITAIQIG